MAVLLYEGLIQQETFMRLNLEKAILVPIPLHPSKLRQRGYNQAEMLGRDLSKKCSLQIRNGLQRIRNTDSQTTLDRKKRQENIKGAFIVLESYTDSFKGETILLIDDVLTSGATLSEAARVLKKNGAGDVYGVTLAHGE
jgi:ComF family protein